MSYKLEHKTIGFGFDPESRQPTQGIEGVFFIPSYQRGYRWTDEVTKLLDDIWESAGQSYSLQPIVVQRRSDGAWDLIDGQQRLTTLWLLLRYMKKGEQHYSLKYQTRPGSQVYLHQLDSGLANQNIDYFYMHEAHVKITAWFVNKGAERHQYVVNEMFRFLSTSVRVIWYEVPDSEKPIPLFTRLNQGRIPLTDAELIKATLLTQIAMDKPGREIEVAAQWDGIERDLQRHEIWAFVAHGTQQHDTRIDLLLDTIAKKPAKPDRYHTFDVLQPAAKNNSLAFWKEVVALHAQILGWFEEPCCYNKIGFLVTCGVSIGEILQLAQGQSKKAFNGALTTRITKTINTKAADLDDTLSYENRSDNLTLLRLLLLFNVETCKERFPFEKHMGQDWTLEHIHAQNAQDLKRKDQWKSWLQVHNDALQSIKTEDNKPSIVNLLDAAKAASLDIDMDSPRFGQQQFNELVSRILLALNGGVVEGSDHSIANLALLSHGANSYLSNAVFEVKRNRVLEMDKCGDYIPVATRNVFLKYYTPADQLQPHFWGDPDKTAYLETIKRTLDAYLQ